MAMERYNQPDWMTITFYIINIVLTIIFTFESIVKLLFLGTLFIIRNQNLHLLDSQERTIFFDSYSSWLGDLFEHGAAVTAFVVKFEWLPPKDIGS